MIDTDEAGQRKWDKVVAQFDEDRESDFWTDFERAFISGQARTRYATFSPRQKNTVGAIYDKVVKS